MFAALAKVDESLVSELPPEDVIPKIEGILSMRMRDTLSPIEEVVAALGDTCRISSSTWLVSCDLTVGEIWERLWPLVLAKQERIVVVPIASGSEWRLHSGSEDGDVCAWLCKRLSDTPIQSLNH